ncbi:hypothetical protein L1049_021030 [Liquidambar formosana]|uniref:Agenet domain-containing protein n=1 Tax=Liquidambar formosana TaxID=63359 RepID=A0AAP0S8X1_LIQFO
MADSYFRKGAEVEVSSDEEGFRGAWYTARIIKPPPKSTKNNTKVLIEYKTLMADEAGLKPLREKVDLVQIRPPPPRESNRSFQFSDEVDAYHNEGWWEGVVTALLDNSRYTVFFRTTREQIEFRQSDLRLHREWVSGNWVPPLENEGVSPTEEVKTSKATVKEKFSKGTIVEKMSPAAEVKTGKAMAKEKFSKGTLVEVSSDEEGFQGAWFAATIVKAVGKDKFLIEYQSLRTDDDTEFLREEIDTLHIRPYPPETVMIDRFNLLDEVDALYNDGWWVGVISKVLVGSRYIVYFRTTSEEMEFSHSDLRPHHEWIDSKWVQGSRVIEMSSNA